ncbi:MAG: helix-turn-helix transcriptional regulator [Bacilli bacterium]
MEVVNVNEKMKEQRKILNFTQVNLAEKLGIRQDLYSRYENGRLNIPSALIPEICYHLSCTPDELYEYDRYLKLREQEKKPLAKKKL